VSKIIAICIKFLFNVACQKLSNSANALRASQEIIVACFFLRC